MNNNSLILAALLVLIVFLSASDVSAEKSEIIDDNLTYSATSEITVRTADTNDQIQEKINSLQDGDTLTFEKGDYNDICLYVNGTGITINGNGATLHGLDNLTTKDLGEVKDGVYTPGRIPEIISNKTTEGGYGISNPAALYILKTDNLVINDLNIVAGENSGTDKGADVSRYSNCLVYNYQSTNTQIINSTFDGSTWGIYYFQSTGGLIEGNKVKNQGVTGIFNFQTPNTLIRNNIVTNAKNHGIDVRHMVGPNVKVLDNKVVGSKEGIYLLHSGKHTVTGNTIINCSLSSITCCGANNILIENNTFQNSRIGVLLAGSAPVGGSYVGYTNITIGTNEWKLDQLPFPPSFVFYVAEAKSDYATVESMMGTHSDSLYGDTYTPYTGIKTPEPIVVDYDKILAPTNTTITIRSGMTSAQIQEAINSMNDGDTLIFEENAVFEDVCIYIDKDIKVIGNHATLKGMNSVSYDYVPEIVTNRTSAGGYAIQNIAVLYVLNTTNAVISDLNIVANYPKYTLPVVAGQNENYLAYYSTGIYAGLSKNLVITGCSVTGASWGIFLGGRPDGDYKYGCQNAIITKNTVKNQYTTGIINFASPNSIIANNTVTNAVNHGIDVRFPAGFGAKVFNNTISGSKEGIYLLHSYGHYVYNNIILNSKISSITCYGSHDEYIFNNTLSKSRIAILLGGSSDNSYYNVTLGPNTFDGDKLPFPPTFAFTLAKSENQYQSATNVIGTYSDKKLVTIIAEDVETEPHTGQFTFTLIDQNRELVNNANVIVTIGDEIYRVKTDYVGEATIDLDLNTGNYTAEINYAGSDDHAKATTTANIVVLSDKIATTLTAKDAVTVYNTSSRYYVTLKDADGNPIAGAKVKLVLGDISKTVKTDSKGRISANLKSLAPGTYTAIATFAGDEIYAPSNTTATVTVTKVPTVLTANDVVTLYNTSSRYYVTLKDANGNPLVGMKVNLVIGTINKTVKTDSKGRISANLKSLAPGTYTAIATFAGTEIYVPAKATATITVNQIQTVLTAKDVVTVYNTSSRYYVTLKDADGNPIVGAKVKLVLGTINKTVKTDTNGRISANLKNQAPGTYTAMVSYAGTDLYAPADTTANVVVNKIATELTAKNVAIDYNTNYRYYVTLKDANGNPIVGAKVKLVLGTINKTVKTDTNGRISANLKNQAPGTYTAMVSYAGSEIYDSSNTTSNVVIR